MNEDQSYVKPAASFALLKNVQNNMILVDRLIHRPPGLPGIGVMHGPSGFGKSYASIYAQNKTQALRVEIGDSWTKATLLKAILQEGGEAQPRGTVESLARQAIMLLGDDPRRPLIIDEADKAVDKKMIELVREMHEHSQAPILLIGEEMLPQKLMRIERVHNRVLDWLPAAPCDMADTRQLAAMLVPGVAVSDDLLERVRLSAEGRARRICTSFATLAEWARNTGAKSVDLAGYRGRIVDGKPPVRRDLVRPPVLKTVKGAAA